MSDFLFGNNTAFGVCLKKKGRWETVDNVYKIFPTKEEREKYISRYCISNAQNANKILEMNRFTAVLQYE